MDRIPIAALAAALMLSIALPAAAGETRHELSQGSTLTTEEGDEVITDRATLDDISMQTQGQIDPSLEAYWAGSDFSVSFTNEDIGYVEMDDWDELEVDDLWQSYVDGAREQSKTFGYDITPLRWVVEPTLDRENAVAYYALEVRFGTEEPLINMVIYDFGRYGYEEMTLVQDSASFPAGQANAIATQIAGAYQFGAGSDYGDFTTGDTVAAIGAGGLIAAAFGAKFGKGLLVLALVFAKKLWFLLLIIPAAIWKFFTGRSKKGEAEA